MTERGSDLGIIFIVFLFVIYYVVVAYLAFHPNVSEWYDLYYISKTTNITTKEREAFSPISPGETYIYNDRRIGFDGWSQAEDKFRWSDGRVAKIVFIVTDDTVKKLKGKLIISFSTHGSQLVELSLNGNISFFSGRFLGRSVMDAQFPVKELTSGENQLVFMLPDAHPPGTVDRRVLGISLKSLTFE